MDNFKKDENVARFAITDFYKRTQDFYIELTSDITKRFDFRDVLIFNYICHQKCNNLKLYHEWPVHVVLDFA